MQLATILSMEDLVEFGFPIRPYVLSVYVS